jgi:hypothetical protein
MLARKKELREKGIPSDAEHAMVAQVHGKDDSPALAAKRKRSPAKAATGKGSSRKAVHKHASH